MVEFLATQVGPLTLGTWIIFAAAMIIVIAVAGRALDWLGNTEAAQAARTTTSQTETTGQVNSALRRYPVVIGEEHAPRGGNDDIQVWVDGNKLHVRSLRDKSLRYLVGMQTVVFRGMIEVGVVTFRAGVSHVLVEGDLPMDKLQKGDAVSFSNVSSATPNERPAQTTPTAS